MLKNRIAQFNAFRKTVRRDDSTSPQIEIQKTAHAVGHACVHPAGDLRPLHRPYVLEMGRCDDDRRQRHPVDLLYAADGRLGIIGDVSHLDQRLYRAVGLCVTVRHNSASIADNVSPIEA